MTGEDAGTCTYTQAQPRRASRARYTPTPAGSPITRLADALHAAAAVRRARADQAVMAAARSINHDDPISVLRLWLDMTSDHPGSWPEMVASYINTHARSHARSQRSA